MKRNKEREKVKKEQWGKRQDAGNKRQHGDEPQKLLDKKRGIPVEAEWEIRWNTIGRHEKNGEIKKEGNLK